MVSHQTGSTMEMLLFAMVFLATSALSTSGVQIVRDGSRPPPPPLLPNLPWPASMQGQDDENYPTMLLSPAGGSTPALLERYDALHQMSPGIRRYNMFWNTFEIAASQAAPFACPVGGVLVPSNATQKKEQGYHRYHCYSARQLANFQTIFELDAKIGAQNAAIIYSAPAFYRNPNCTGFVFGKDVIKGGCAPMDDHMDDYEDYIRMLVDRWAPHYLKHFIVWNEVASAGWMDMSPLIPNRAGPNGSFPLTEAQFDLWVQKYADLMTRTGLVVANAHLEDAVMVWSSNDRLWERPLQREGEPLHTGVKNFQDRLWPKLSASGASLSTFAMAVHPYDPGNPMDASEFAPGAHPQRYTFATLGHIVNYTKQQLQKYKHMDPSSPAARPYLALFASEQGWPSPACCNDQIRSRNICYAHALSTSMDFMFGVTHNYFQDNPGGSEQGGQDYGLIPGNVSSDLRNGRGHPTFDAYNSTAPAVWEHSDTHFCCARFSVGCQTKHVHGVFDPVARTPVRNTYTESNADIGGGGSGVWLHGWAWDESAPLAGHDPVSVRIVVTGKASTTITVVANVSRPDITKTWDGGSAPNAEHGFHVFVPLEEVSTIENMGSTVDYRLSVYSLSPNSGAATELDESPRCICMGLKPCPCV
eukprot:m.513859 g.513859  ORF g.513859 m.513859 type:complete len:644 (-) comp21909_c0_seq5:122-2053(-)